MAPNLDTLTPNLETQSPEDIEAIKSAKELPTSVRELADMDAGTGNNYLSSVVLSSLNEGDSFKVGEKTYTVTRKTKPKKYNIRK